MKWALNILAVLFLIVGGIWILQGTGVYPVGFMAHDMRYAYAGIVIVLVAIGFFIIANRSRKKLPPA